MLVYMTVGDEGCKRVYTEVIAWMNVSRNKDSHTNIQFHRFIGSWIIQGRGGGGVRLDLLGT